MEKVCEYCVTLRSVIYCKADAAHLCLSCDAKVHSANSLSSRHPRTLVCESCKYRPTYLRCYDHQLFMCRGCDQTHHAFSSQHRKRLITSYMGSPSAHDLALLWGFTLNDFGLTTSTSTNSTIGARSSQLGPNGRYLKAFNSAKPKENTSYIVQQLLNLRKPQSTEECESFSLIRHHEQTHISSSNTNQLNLENNFDHNLQQSDGHGNDHLHMDHPQPELHLEPYSLPFSQLDQLASSSANGSPLHGDSFWQCKSPVQSGQLWSHNMQDLGVCEELVLDDLNIPDVDLTFRNFEELFQGEQEETGDTGMTWSSVDVDTFIDRSDHPLATSVESSYMSPPKRARSTSRSKDYEIKPSYSALSLSLSRLSAESSGTGYMDSRLSPLFGREHSCKSPDQVTAPKEAKGNILSAYKEKQKDQRNDHKPVESAYRRPRSDIRKQAKSQIMKADGYECDMARSY